MVVALATSVAAAQTRVDLRTQAKSVDFSGAGSTKPLKTGTTLPAACSVGEVFFKTSAQAGANLYACTAADTWSVEGIAGQNCWADAASGLLKCQDSQGNTYVPVKTSTGGTANQWVDYIDSTGTPHTSQPTASAVGATADPGANGIVYRGGAGAAQPANANQLSGPFFCQDNGSSGAYACNLSPAIAAYTTGATYWFRANTANSGAASINFNSLGAKTIKKQATADLAAGDIKAGQWVLVTYDGSNMQMQSPPAVVTWSTLTGKPSTFTPAAHASTHQNGGSDALSLDASQIASGTLNALRLPPSAMQTAQSNTITGGTQDFSAAAHTLPMKSGTLAAMPAVCAIGEAYFATDAAAGSNLYGCTAANTWTAQAGAESTGGTGAMSLGVQSSGSLVGSRPAINVIPGAGMETLLADTGSQINIQMSLDSAVVQTQPGEQSGTSLLCAGAGANSSHYQCALSPTAGAYTTGMVLHWIPDVNGAGGATTLNVDTLGDTPVKMPDGITDPGSSDIVGGRLYSVWYDGTLFRMIATTGGQAGGNTILNGTSGPAAGAGANGDFFLRTDTSCLYGPKVGGAWPGSCTALTGPAGPPGTIYPPYQCPTISGTSVTCTHNFGQANVWPSCIDATRTALGSTTAVVSVIGWQTDAAGNSTTISFDGDATGSRCWISAGTMGPKGDSGAAGAQGPQGPAGSAGATGAAGQGFTWRGAWSSGTSYAAYDVVSYNGSSYNAIAASTGVTPGTDGTKWAAAAMKGDIGPAGPAGSGSGDVLGPASNHAGWIPLWNGASSKTLADGLDPATLMTTSTAVAVSQLPAQDKSRRIGGYETVGTGTGGVLQGSDIAQGAIAVNDNNAKTLTEASCVSDAGSQALTYKIGSTTLFTITCVPSASYSRSTTDGSTGYIVAGSMNSAALAAGAIIDQSGTANGSTKDAKIHIYGTVN